MMYSLAVELHAKVLEQCDFVLFIANHRVDAFFTITVRITIPYTQCHIKFSLFANHPTCALYSHKIMSSLGLRRANSLCIL